MSKAMLSRIRTAVARTRATLQMQTNSLSAFRFFLAATEHTRGGKTVERFRWKGLEFYIRANDWYSLQEVFLEAEYSFVEPVMRDIAYPVVVDLGANIGAFSLYTLSLKNNADIYAVEPGQETYELLQRNIQLNTGVRWTAFHAAMWKEDGTVQFETRGLSTASRVAADSSIGNETVPAMSLDTLLSTHVKKPVHLLKIDIEGAEEVVLGHREELLATVQNIIVEVHPNLCNLGNVVKTLRSSHEYIYRVPGRRSAKPLLLATRSRQSLPLYE